MRKKIVLLLLSLFLLVAWSPNDGEAPYTGNFSVSYPSPAQVKSSATSIKWTQTAINDMDGDGNAEYLDQTADCVGSGGDRLGVGSVLSNIPNHGVYAYNDCSSSSSVLEEVELHINEDSLVKETSYYYNIVWLCKAAWTSGEINISFEPASWSHDWLDKVFYGYPGCSNTGLVPDQSITVNNTENDSSSKQTTQPLITQQNQTDMIHHFESDTFAYEVVRDKYGELRIHVNVEFENPRTFNAYKAFNKEIATGLALSEQPLLTVITFASPLGIGELQELTRSAEMEVISFGTFGWGQENDVTSIYQWPQSKKVEEFPADENISVAGVMTVRGFINPLYLSALLTDDRIVLVDVIANQIQLQVEDDLGETVQLTNISVPNPAWLQFE